MEGSPGDVRVDGPSLVLSYVIAPEAGVEMALMHAERE